MAKRVVPTMICSDQASLCISSNGDVYSAGNSNSGVHGHGRNGISIKQFTVIPSLHHITNIDCCSNFTICLDNEGSVFTFGSNEYGQLGVSNRKDLPRSYTPQKVELPPCKQVCCGDSFAICVSDSSEVYSFGFNPYGQLGYDLNMPIIPHTSTPKKIESLKDVDFVSCGSIHVICKTMDNQVYGWGNSSIGQLGFKEKDNITTPTKLENWMDDVVDIKCGTSHTLVLTANQEVFSCGTNRYGQLGRLGKTYSYSPALKKVRELSDIVRIECGNDSSLCIDVYNNLFVFGYNNMYNNGGHLGLGDSKNCYKPVKHPLSNVIDVSKGNKQAFVKTSNNEIFAFGENSSSQLGTETKEFIQKTPIRVLEHNEDIWFSNINKSKQKSARSVFPRPSNEEDNSPPKKKQK